MRLCPSCRGETTFRSSHHWSWRKLTWAMRATSLLLKVLSAAAAVSGRVFFVLNMKPRFRFNYTDYRRHRNCTEPTAGVNRKNVGRSRFVVARLGQVSAALLSASDELDDF